MGGGSGVDAGALGGSLHNVIHAPLRNREDASVGWVQGWAHRKTPVLALYPLDLNHVEERFGTG